MSVNNVSGVVNLSPTRNPFNYDMVVQTSRDLATAWLTLEEITQQLNLFGDESQDSYLSDLELSVRMHIEDYLGMPIFNQSYTVYYGASALYGTPLSLDLPEVSQGGVNIDSVKYYNNATPTALITVAPSTYYYDVTGNKVILNDLPTNLNTVMTSPVVCNYTIMPSILAQYPVIKRAGLLLLTHLYNNRSAVGDSVGIKSPIPFGVDVLLRQYKPLVM